ncbi:thioredoxin family protein [Marmoricola endophyticus]|uniref:Thioredoxin family protein n=1 Tax=Marmoricola endophyticus TaxID=2040280 RepID=A0A917BKD5_9ACTN|nr:glutaredoxin family protein [Marmoricola endophyticus]GGF45313.1 thioredoxin family protein [Marmoricola endophyticus]
MPDPADASRPEPRVVVYSRPGCHLCEAALEIVARVCADLEETFVEVDITGDDDLLASYAEEIPVTLVDGERHDFWRVDEARLRHSLSARR